ncbi:unnamed protein product [Clonostachys rosea]|uniref:Altered inheritance of mitochondria protein 41 n=1 Tax=Bionectria ochroleuca TaxID=29856 RepID=A0ABY6V269_BIOOC|nr:unnamed protein product [Clonostachys rosea]
MASRQSLRALQAIRSSSVPTASYRPRTWQSLRFYSEAAADETPASPPYLQHLKADLKTAMRAKDAPRLAVLRAILSENLNASKTRTPIRTDPQLVIKIIKMRRSIEESAAEAKKVGRDDLAEKELEQAKIMGEYIARSKLEVLGEEQLRPMIKEEIELSIVEGDQSKTLMADVIKRIKVATEDKVVENKILAPLVKELINERNKQNRSTFNMSRINISSGSAFEAEIGYSRAVVVDGWVLVSGTTGYDYQTGKISPNVEEQAEQTLANIAKALEEAGSSMSEVVRVQYVLPDRDDFPKTWPVLKKWFGDVCPAAMMIESKLMKEEMKIEIEVTAKKGCAKQ